MGQGARAGCLFVIGAWLAGCAVGPDFAPPAAPNVNGYTPEPLASAVTGSATPGGNAQRFVRDLDLPGQWWTLFHSKPLNELIDRALAANRAALFGCGYFSVHLIFCSCGLLNIWPQIFFAVDQLLPWRLRLKKLSAMTARADEHTRQRIRTCETDMRARRTKDRDESHSNACGGECATWWRLRLSTPRSQRKFADWANGCGRYVVARATDYSRSASSPSNHDARRWLRALGFNQFFPEK
jgi:hypothetical protein